jgi:hypothetical protein
MPTRSCTRSRRLRRIAELLQAELPQASIAGLQGYM